MSKRHSYQIATIDCRHDERHAIACCWDILGGLIKMLPGDALVPSPGKWEIEEHATAFPVLDRTTADVIGEERAWNSTTVTASLVVTMKEGLAISVAFAPGLLITLHTSDGIWGGYGDVLNNWPSVKEG